LTEPSLPLQLADRSRSWRSSTSGSCPDSVQ